MNIKTKNDLRLKVIIEEIAELKNLDQLEVQVFDAKEAIWLEECGREPVPFATVRLWRILGRGSHNFIVDTADAMDGDMYGAANAVFGHEDDPDYQEYLTALFKMESYPIQFADKMLYLDNIALFEKVSAEQMSVVLSAAIQATTKGLTQDGWVTAVYAKGTVVVPVIEPDGAVRYDAWSDDSFKKALKAAGFRTTRNGKQFGGNPIYAVASGTLKLDIKPKANKAAAPKL